MSATDQGDAQAETRNDRFARQRTVGLLLAAAIIGGWIAIHALMVWVYELGHHSPAIALVAIAVQTWLSVGLFIVAHDCMHGSLAPFRPRLNRWVGRLALALYAGLHYDRLVPKHFAHHKSPGTEHDPDFDAAHPDRFWPWFGTFMREYLSLRDFLLLTAALGLYLWLGAPLANVMAFWAVPAWLSAVQIFYFGTYLPHRREEAASFPDAHRTRSNDYPWLVSLLTCFHFGYHHEHHRHPRVPWWQLPRQRLADG